MFDLLMFLTPLLTVTTAASAGGADLWIQWVYSNPDSMLDDGRICDRFSNRHCDVYFTLCLRNAADLDTRRDKCSVFEKTTENYDNAVFLNFSGNKAAHGTIPAPVPNLYTFELDIYDSDFLPNYEVVGNFISENFELTPKDQFQLIPLVNRNARSANKRLSLTVEMKLVCKMSYYGKHCATMCIPDPSKYDCDEDGRKLCKPGFTGEDCEKEDSCFYERCANHAACKNREDGTGRICICNGQEGPQCYPGYDPCSPTPCVHGGKCHSVGPYGESFRCECPEEWAGHRCTERRLACLEAAELLSNQRSMPTNDSPLNNETVEVCLNGGKCLEYSDRFAYRCVCADGWVGERCENPIVHTSNNLMFILVLLAGAFLAILVIVLTVGLIWRGRRFKWHDSYTPRHGGIVYYHSDRDSTATIASILPLPLNHTNEVYGSPTLTEKIYISSPKVRTMNSGKRHHNDVYDECDPLGLDSKSGLYGSAFENEGLISEPTIRNSVQLGQDESAPPLPERPKDLSQAFSGQTSVMSLSASEAGTPCGVDTLKSPKEKRQPTIYRPLSPTFTPTTIERRSRPTILT